MSVLDSYSNGGNNSSISVESRLKLLLGLASECLISIGSIFSEKKEELGSKDFGSWLEENGFVRSVANQAIGVHREFENATDAILELGPTVLTRFSAPRLVQAREKLFATAADELNQQVAEKIRKDLTPPPQSKDKAKLVNNRPGGVPIFRYQVHGIELSQDLNADYKQANCFPDRWMRQLLDCKNLVKNMSARILGVTEFSESLFDDLWNWVKLQADVAFPFLLESSAILPLLKPAEEVSTNTNNAEENVTLSKDCNASNTVLEQLSLMVEELKQLEQEYTTYTKTYGSDIIKRRENILKQEELTNQIQAIAVEHNIEIGSIPIFQKYG